jgi:hypothetical protein
MVFSSKKSIPQGYSKSLPIFLRYTSLLTRFGERNIRQDSNIKKRIFLVIVK